MQVLPHASNVVIKFCISTGDTDDIYLVTEDPRWIQGEFQERPEGGKIMSYIHTFSSGMQARHAGQACRYRQVCI